MESDGDVVLLGFAPDSGRASVSAWHLLIHHTSRGPGSDTLQCLPRPAAKFALSPVMHACSPLPLFSYPCFHPLFLSLSECQGYQRCLGQDGQTLFYSRHVFIHAPHPALFTRVCVCVCLSLSPGNSPSLCLFCLSFSPTCGLV